MLWPLGKDHNWDGRITQEERADSQRRRYLGISQIPPRGGVLQYFFHAATLEHSCRNPSESRLQTLSRRQR